MKNSLLLKNFTAALSFCMVVAAHSAQAANETLNAVGSTTATAVPEHSTFAGVILLVGALLWSCRRSFMTAWKMSAPAAKD
jgi:hypothetical protein